MLGFLTKKEDQIKKESEERVSKLESLATSLEKELKKTKSELKEEKEKNHKYFDEINSLKWALEEEREKTRSIQDDSYKDLYFGLLELFGFENHNIEKSMLNIQENIAIATTKAKDSLKLSDSVDENFEEAFKNIKKIVINLDELLTRSNRVASVIDELSKKAIDIEKFVAQINEVVMQINILSLNASVEAASAGDAGKGFAVVASEVKNLANKTSDVASDIEKVVKTIQSSIKNTNKEFHEIDENIISIHNSTKEYNGEIESLHKLTKLSLNELNNISDSVFMNLAKIDHVLWKINTYSSVYEKKPTFEFVSHKNCRLGKWYESGDGIKYFSKAKSYYKLDKPHASIHDTTHKVFALLRDNDIDMNYQRIKDAFSYMEENSKEVFKILDDILEETVSK